MRASVNETIESTEDFAMKILVTGGSGRLGSSLVPALVRAGHIVTSVDLTPHPIDSVCSIIGDLTDPAVIQNILQGQDALVHLAAHPDSPDWRALEALNMRATRMLFDTAFTSGLKAVIFASSIHVAGMLSWDEQFDNSAPVAPDSAYGVSKAFGEAILRYVAARDGLACFALRIGTCRTPPQTMRERYTWLSPSDFARLVLACLSHSEPGYRTIWGFSQNVGAKIDRSDWARVGYVPVDNAEDWLDQLDPNPAIDGLGYGLIGGRFVSSRGKDMLWKSLDTDRQG